MEEGQTMADAMLKPEPFFFKLTQLHFSLFNFSFTQFSFDGDSCYALLLVTFLCLLLLYSLYKMLYYFND